MLSARFRPITAIPTTPICCLDITNSCQVLMPHWTQRQWGEVMGMLTHAAKGRYSWPPTVFAVQMMLNKLFLNQWH